MNQTWLGRGKSCGRWNLEFGDRYVRTAGFLNETKDLTQGRERDHQRLEAEPVNTNGMQSCILLLVSPDSVTLTVHHEQGRDS